MVVRDWATPIFTEHNNHFLERWAVISRSTLRTANVMLLFLMTKKETVIVLFSLSLSLHIA